MKRALAMGCALAFACTFTLALPAFAQPGPVDPAMQDLQQAQQKRAIVQPGNNAPVWREVRSGDQSPAYASIPGRETNVLVQTAGQEWRAKRNGLWSIAAGWALVLMLVVLSAFYFVKGTVQLEQPETGRKIVRFTHWERWVHWSVAISFSIMAISGLIMLFGKNILLPVIGYTLFSGLANLSKYLHNFIGPLFFVSVLVLVATFIRDNFPRAYDIKWLLHFGGMIGKEPVHAGKFNGGEKIWFWGGALFLGVVVGLSGLVLDFPNFDQTRSTMQTANIIHLIGAGLFIVGGLGHIYLGTIGMAGAYDAMRHGTVDEEWAREHHDLWYEDIKAGRVSADREADKARAAAPASGPAD